ncbi:MAG: 2,3-bisphosphoglycerate-independent phosphoglycerate mutase [Parcubacteria group bacterium Athens1014_26]|nr:MAG: 2,3-bisphosphoglycerate-independent phosphoglycerate mutase [Parcubacteria group bacterium Athens1014_26]
MDKNIKIASISGRYYALDRDSHWDRTQEAYKILTGNGPITNNPENLIKKTYQDNLNDQFVKPHLIGPENNGIKNNDSIIFFDFREDSVRQIVEAFINPDFQEFPVKPLNNLFIGTMTRYAEKFSDQFKIPVAFPPEKIGNPLGKVLADNKKSQLRLAETEKYAHVTYFFNGLNDKPYPNEFRIIVPSHNVISHAEHPEMMAAEITSRIMQSMEDNAFDFILANYANGDLIAHTGNFEAGLKAVKILDEEMAKLIKKTIEQDDILIITSDHGNIENMFDLRTAEPTTGHDSSAVPIYLVGREFQKIKTLPECEDIEKQTVGILSDIAPTILELMSIEKPDEMTGNSLIGLLE